MAGLGDFDTRSLCRSLVEHGSSGVAHTGAYLGIQLKEATFAKSLGDEYQKNCPK